MPPFSNSAWLADLGAMLGMYVNSLLNFIPSAVKALARERICSNLRVGFSVGTYGSNLLFFFL